MNTCSTASFTWKDHTWDTHDNLIGHYKGAEGMKTGYTVMSGFNLVSSVVRNNHHVIGIVMGGRTAIRRDLEMEHLLDTVFAKIDDDTTLVARGPVPWTTPSELNPKAATAGFALASNDDAGRRYSVLSALPPELLRKGRFDEIFFVDLPDSADRRTIFNIHLARRKQDASRFDLDRLAAASEGFSGAEIEQAQHRPFVDLADLDVRRELEDLLLRRLASLCARRRDRHGAVVLDFDRRSGCLLQATDHDAALADDVADLLGVDLDRDDARRELAHLAARLGQHGQHLVQHEHARHPSLLRVLILRLDASLRPDMRRPSRLRRRRKLRPPMRAPIPKPRRRPNSAPSVPAGKGAKVTSTCAGRSIASCSSTSTWPR